MRHLQKWANLLFRLFEKNVLVFDSANPQGVRLHLQTSIFSKNPEKSDLADFCKHL